MNILCISVISILSSRRLLHVAGAGRDARTFNIKEAGEDI